MNVKEETQYVLFKGKGAFRGSVSIVDILWKCSAVEIGN